MKRRHLLTAAAATAAAQMLPSRSQQLQAAAPQGGPMKLGCQSAPTDDKRLQFFARHGVQGICGYPRDSQNQGFYSVEDISRAKDICDKYKIELECIAPPYLASSHIDKTPRPAIMLGQSPERDRDIEQLNIMIRNCAKAGVPSIKYNMSILGVLRTGRTPARGGSTYSTWNLADAKSSGKFPPETRAGRVTADMYWERITYFLDRVIPVANEYKVRMACHPHDPGVPPVEGFQKVDAVLGTPDGLKKFISIRESPYHGLNFCQGTVSEMLQDPGTELYDIIRYFGSRKKIFNVHFRNIRGRRNAFEETYPDDGDVDFVKAMMVYKEVGYPYLMMPDHVPFHPDDKGGDQAFAFAYGYIRALIQSVGRTA
ncbi:MAG: mannonate dehydratase [Bryobacteraceae bacterium]